MAQSLQRLCVSCISKNIEYWSSHFDLHLLAPNYRYLLTPFDMLPEYFIQEIIMQVLSQKKFTLQVLCLFADSDLTRLNLKKCAQANDQFIEHLAFHAVNIKYLNLKMCKKVTKIKPLVNCTKLEILNLSDCSKVQDSCLVFILPFLQLRSLHIQNTKATENTIKAILQSKCVNSLEKLNVSGLLIDSKSIFKLIQTMKNLKNLKLQICNNINDSAFVPSDFKIYQENDYKYNNAAKLSNPLQKLDVSLCDIGDHSIAYIVNNFSFLKTLTLFGCPKITNDSVTFISEKLTDQLEHLNLCGTSINSTGLSFLFQREMMSMTKAIFSNIIFDLNTSILLGKSLVNVTHLDISLCRLQNEYVQEILIGCGKNIEKLILHSNPLLTSESLRCITMFCQKLKLLDLHENFRIDQVGISVLTKHKISQSVQSLDVRKCDVDVKLVKSLIKNCHSLSFLDVRNCPNISSKPHQMQSIKANHLTLLWE